MKLHWVVEDEQQMSVGSWEGDAGERNVDDVGERVVVAEFGHGLRAVREGDGEVRVVRDESGVRGGGEGGGVRKLAVGGARVFRELMKVESGRVRAVGEFEQFYNEAAVCRGMGKDFLVVGN